MSGVVLGTNDFFGVPFPLVVGDRFFHLYRDDRGRMLVDVFRWDENAATATYEVVGSVPQDTSSITNPTGVVTFVEDDGGFLFKFRPREGASQLFGQVPAGERDVLINDQEIRVMRGGTVEATFVGNSITGCLVGLHLRTDGGMAFASNALPKGMRLERRSAI